MSVLGLKWTPGAPPKLIAGMALRRESTKAVELVGTHTAKDTSTTLMGDCAEWCQLIAGYELEWLGNTGAL